MDLSDRIKEILKENKLKQKVLASNIGVTESYISAIINKRNNVISQSLASLIEEKYGYNSNWVLKGEEPKLKQVSKNATLSNIHKKAIMQIEKMNDEQIKAVLAFLNSLDEIEKNIREEISETENELSADKEAEIEAEGEAYKDELRLEANLKTSQASLKKNENAVSFTEEKRKRSKLK